MIACVILFFSYDTATDIILENEFGSLHFIVESIMFLGVSLALAETINNRLDEWEMTNSERNIAWLVIKGYRFYEIAALRGVKESITRLQTSLLYSKAGVSGRSELVAEVVQALLFTTSDTPASSNRPFSRTPAK